MVDLTVVVLTVVVHFRHSSVGVCGLRDVINTFTDECSEVCKLHNMYSSDGVLVRRRDICIEQHSCGVVHSCPQASAKESNSCLLAVAVEICNNWVCVCVAHLLKINHDGRTGMVMQE